MNGEEMLAAVTDFSFKQLGKKQKRQDKVTIEGDAGFKERSGFYSYMLSGRSLQKKKKKREREREREKVKLRVKAGGRPEHELIYFGPCQIRCCTMLSSKETPPHEFLKLVSQPSRSETLFCPPVFQTSNSNNFRTIPLRSDHTL